MACADLLSYLIQMYPVVEFLLSGVEKRFSDKFTVIVELSRLVAITRKYI
jgi:hypothetical protein